MDWYVTLNIGGGFWLVVLAVVASSAFSYWLHSEDN